MEKQERRLEQKEELRKKLSASDKEAVLKAIVPRVLSKKERALQAAERRKEQQKNKPSAKQKPAAKSKASRKLKLSSSQKASLKKKASVKEKPCAKRKRDEKNELKNQVRLGFHCVKAAVERLSQIADFHGIPRKPGKLVSPSSKKESSPGKLLDTPSKKESSPGKLLNTPSKADFTEASTVLVEAQEQLLKATALRAQLEEDLDRTEKREVHFLEAQMQQIQSKVKNTEEGTGRKSDSPSPPSLFFERCIFDVK